MVNQGPLAVSPDSIVVELLYFTFITFELDTNPFAVHVWSLNSAYDPGFSSGSTQPGGYDEWSAFFSRYRVLEADVELKAAHPVGVSSFLWGVRPSPTSGSEANLPAVLVDPRSEFGISGPSHPWMFRKRYDIRELFGLTKEQFGEDDYSAVVSAGPVSQMYFQVAGSTITGSTATLDPVVAIRIKYKIQFYSRTNLSPSLSFSTFSSLTENQKTKLLEYAKVLKQLPDSKSN